MNVLKRAVLSLIVALLAVAANAQEMQDVVYLKNGSIVRGIVIEQVPNTSIKIRTADGSVFACNMNEVEKLTKEENGNASRKISKRMQGKGYRGFVDFGYAIKSGDLGVSRVELTTTHGYQITPFFFIGAGIGLDYYHEAETWGLPLFGEVRSEILRGKFAPFVDVKVGYTFMDVDGMYIHPSIGCRFELTNTIGLNVSLGYSMQYVEAPKDPKEPFGTVAEKNCGAISLKVGIDF